MNVIYVREAHLAQLKSNISNNLELYKSNDPWLESYFENDAWNLQSNIYIEDIHLVEPKSVTEHFDFENTKIIFSKFKDLTVAQAIDERLWTYLSHVTFWKYMRARWPVESYMDKSNAPENIRDRYFFMPNRDRALIRNGIARLWWYGYVSYDENREDPFELTRILLSKLDIAQNLLERTFSRNRLITKTILSVLAKMDSMNKPTIDREKFRKLMMYINYLGGVTILDALDENDIEKIVVSRIDKIA